MIQAMLEKQNVNINSRFDVNDSKFDEQNNKFDEVKSNFNEKLNER